jgi:hypothetical protein
MEALRARRSGGVSFDDLSEDDRNYLATECAQVRKPLMKCFGASDNFRLIAVARDQLGALRVPPWWPEIVGKRVSFAEFESIPARDAHDPRNVTGTKESYALPRDPVTIAHFAQQAWLLDGYHRAVAFWRYAPADASLDAYEPCQ